MQRAAIQSGLGLSFTSLLRRGLFPEVVLVQTRALELDQAVLGRAVADHLATRYRDPVLLVRIVEKGSLRAARTEGDLDVVDLDGADLARACAAARSAGGAAPPRERVTLAFHRAVADALGRHPLRPAYAQYHVSVHGPFHADDFGEALRRLVAVAVDPLRLPPPRGSERMPRTPVAIAGRGRGAQEAGTLRVDFGGEVPTPAGLPRFVHAIDRIGRAATERLVGIALGGGGALGFAHVNLLQEFHRRRIPVDFVSGSSFGSVVGAFYAARGVGGLDQLVSLAGDANKALQWSMLLPSRFELWLNGVLDEVRIEELPLTFLPVCTDLVQGVPFIPRSGSIGRGVRLSGAFPPMFLTQDLSGMRLADGGFVANVPAQAVIWEGANMIVASNIVAAPSAEAGTDPDGGRLRTFLRGFNVVRRMIDAYNASFTLIHEAGAWQAVVADVIFEPTSNCVDFWDLSRGAEVVEKSREVARAAGAHAEAVWDGLSSPMVPIASVWPELGAEKAR